RLEEENRELRQRLGKHELVGSGPAMKKLLEQIDRVAASETRVCILGETGTGKELVARAIHEKSPRQGHPFITLNCAAVPAELIESELFGHEKGAFTGAATRHLGKFEQADHGTLFLDEIGDMPLAMQAKLLRVLEEGEIERIGTSKPTQVDVRVIVATHRNLEAHVRDGKFRQDLFHRIFVFPIILPPLRVRLRRRLGLVLWRTALRVSNAKLFLANCGAQITTLQTPQKLSASSAVTFIKRRNSWASTSAPKDVRKSRNCPSSSHWSA